jgi:hypothetical protein
MALLSHLRHIPIYYFKGKEDDKEKPWGNKTGIREEECHLLGCYPMWLL